MGGGGGGYMPPGPRVREHRAPEPPLALPRTMTCAALILTFATIWVGHASHVGWATRDLHIFVGCLLPHLWAFGVRDSVGVQSGEQSFRSGAFGARGPLGAEL